MEYERQKKFISDYAAALAYAKKEGIAIGDERGVKQGIKKERSYIKGLLRQGMSAEELLEGLDNDD